MIQLRTSSKEIKYQKESKQWFHLLIARIDIYILCFPLCNETELQSNPLSKSQGIL